ncbi:MAG TPA: helix-turn-helix domain-containing protein [bacterium]|nr:helix-turn-helix domain-containing protein [bacterium]
MMETLGDFLKQRREAAGLSLEDLAGRTRIRVENLRSLEREDLEALPTDPYVRGFVKLVCRELGLEPSDGLVRYETLRERSGPPDEMTWDEETTEEAPGLLERALGDPENVVRKAAVVGRWGGLAAGVVVVLALGILAFRWIDPFAPRTTKPVAYLAGEAPATPSPELAAIPDPAPPEPEKSEAEPPAAQQPAASPPPRPAPELVGGAAGGSRVVLRLEAARPVRVSVLLDGVGFPRTRSMAAGESATWKADEFFVLDVSDGGAVRVFLGDRELGPAGGDGSSVEDLTVRPR